MARTLLLADDSVTIQKVVGISFAGEDVELIAVDNGDDAIARAREARPDAILADVVMPGKTGYEVCEAIKADPALRHIPVLLLTGTFEAFDEQRANQVGAAGHIAKPFEAQALVDEVNRLFAAPRPAAAVSDAPTAAPLPGPSTAAPDDSLTMADPNEDSFDFFDDDLADADPSVAHPVSAPLSEGEDLELDTDDSAFAFGEDDLSLDTDPGRSSERRTDPMATPGFERAPGGSIEIGPDTSPELASPTPGAKPLEAEVSVSGVLEEPAQTVVAPLGEVAELESSPVRPAEEVDDAFDFAFDAAPQRGASPAQPVADDTDGLDADDFAQATVLDPRMSGDFDVSASDLGGTDPEPAADVASAFGDPGATVLAPEFAAADEAPFREAAASKAAADRPTQPAAPQLTPASLSHAAPEHAPDATVLATDFGEEPLAIAVEEAPEATVLAADLGADPSVEVSTAPAPVPEPVLEPEPMRAPEPLAEPEPESLLVTEPEPADVPKSLSPERAAAAESILERIEPQLRAQLHDTLEKIAWESFSDLTNQIVKQSVERVEAIAWEVIPQLAETLIREEIRRLKGEPADD